VRTWLSAGAPPRWAQPRTSTRLDPQAEFIAKRWAEGCRRPSVLRRELCRRGCSVPRSTLAYWIKTRLTDGTSSSTAASLAVTWKVPTVVGTARLLQADGIGGDDGRFIARVLALAPDLAHAAGLAKRLAAILRKSSSETLASWLADAAASPLKGFAKGLAKDRAAVQAAIDLPWSTSPVEGQINRLKLIKRSMYGRGGFQLLRQRVLLAV